MRLDLFLKKSRLCLKRSLAQQLCEAGMVSVNQRPAKASRTLRLGDEISIHRGNRLIKVRVRSLPEGQTSRKEAANLYELISEGFVEEQRDSLS